MITLSLLLELAPAITFPEVEHDLLNDIYSVTYSPLISGVALESLFRFYSSLVQADNQIATHVVPNLVIAADKAPRTESSPSNVAKCVAQVVRSQLAVAAGTIAEYTKHLKPSSKAKPSLVILSLLIIGELGRFMFVFRIFRCYDIDYLHDCSDMAPQKEIFQLVIDHFGSDLEEMRAAAAFAAGNIAVGNLHQFLPAIVRMVEVDPRKRLLALHAAKEVLPKSPLLLEPDTINILPGCYTLFSCPIGRSCRPFMGSSF